MRLKNILIPCLCLVVAVTVLFGKKCFFQERPPVLSLADPSTSGEKDETITLHYHERPPYYVTGPLDVYGICADPAKLAFEKAGIPFRWEKTPARRQLDIIKANRSQDCLLGWFKNPERETYARYSLPIYLDKPTIALARADNTEIISGRPLADTFANPDLILLRKSGYSYGPFVDAAISKLNPKQVSTDAENIGMLKMIHSKRADYFFITEEEADELTASSGLPKADFKYVKFSDMPEGNRRYLLFSRNVAGEVVEKINAAIKTYVHP